MPAIVVDTTRCKQDGLCVSVCPLGILEQREGAIPSTRANYENACVRCGHCMAVCPHGALLLEGSASSELSPLDTSLYPSPDALAALMRGRRSTRSYTDELVVRSLIEDILDTVRWAPSGKNVQPLRFTVVCGKQRMREISEHAIAYFTSLLQTQTEAALALGAGGLVKAWNAGRDMILRGAPHLIVTHGEKANPLLLSAGVIAMAQFELLATAHGLGACWAGYIEIAANGHAPLRQALGLPTDDVVAAALMFGKPKIKYCAIPARKPLDLRWR